MRTLAPLTCRGVNEVLYSSQLSSIVDLEKLHEMLTTSGVELGIKLLSAIAVFVIGRLIARIIMKGAGRLADNVDLDPLLERFMLNILNILLTVFIIIAALTQLGFEMTSVVAVLGAAGLAVGLALQGSLANFASGVLIVFFKPYRVGDFIEAAGVSGTVNEVSIFNTILTTPDNRRIVVPNASVTSGSIVNFSILDKRRIDLTIGVGYGDDLKVAEKVLRDCVDADERILTTETTTIAVSELADSSVNFVVRPWVKTGDYWPVRFDLLRNIKISLDEAGVSIPFPQREVTIVKSESE
ncbi:MAG: mechanosensitive ion channel domain-containing protein [Pseudomonadota bacterium]